MTLLAMRGVACDRGGRRLFAGLDLMLAAGDAALVTGANGTGKSSLLRLIAGLLDPAEGTVERQPPALVDAALALDPEQRLAAALGWWAAASGGDVTAALADWALAPLADVPVRLLSTGQRQRARLARAALSGRALWLLDEPANGLDAAAAALLDAQVARHRATGGAVVVATHVPVALPGATLVAL